MARKGKVSCTRCGHTDGGVKVYRDPFAHLSESGEWPTITMCSDCFLGYIREWKLRPSAAGSKIVRAR